VRRLPILHILLFFATLATTTIAGALHAEVPFEEMRAHWSAGLPFSISLMTILLAHEMGHYLTARVHGVRATLPFFLPAPPVPFLIGTFGAFIRLRSLPPSRRALFDVGAAGPWAGFVVALVATAIGLAHSTVLAARPERELVELGDSLLTAALTRLVLGIDPSTVTLRLHPIALAGWFGLFVTSVNLLPVGQLDGGHVLYAAAGRATVFVPAVLIASLVWLGWKGWPGWLLWAVIITAFLALGHPPTEDDRRPLGSGRLLATAATFVIFVLTFVAEPFKFVP